MLQHSDTPCLPVRLVPVGRAGTRQVVRVATAVPIRVALGRVYVLGPGQRGADHRLAGAVGHLDGFDVAVATTGSYGGINRVTDVEGPALVGNRDTTGGNVTLPAAQSLWGSATHGGSHPDLVVCDQKIYDQLWMRIQPSQRLPVGPMAEMMAARGPHGQAGFDNIRFNSAMVVVDEKSPAGYLSMYNTEFIELVAHIARANMEVQGPTESVNQDARVWKLLWMGNLVVSSPRMQAVATGLSES